MPSTRRSRRRESPAHKKTIKRAPEPNVFDFMETSPTEDGQDVNNDNDDEDDDTSTSSSHYEESDAGSSGEPDTPSSRSTFPSPTTTRSQSAADLRKSAEGRHDGVERSGSSSPNPSGRCVRQAPTVDDVPEDEDEDGADEEEEEEEREEGAGEDVAGSLPNAIEAPSEPEYEPQRPTSKALRESRRSDRIQEHQESMRQHMAYATQPHHIDPAYSQHEHFSNHSHDPHFPSQMELQQYQFPTAPTPIPPVLPLQPMNGHIMAQQQAFAEQHSDSTSRTVAGYEKLACELSTPESRIKPCYRRFTYLQNRLLLHLQDELVELEEQLAHLDDAIAHLNPSPAPASRRGENLHGSELHRHRTILLGNVFVKMEQYNRALTSFATVERESRVPRSEDVAALRELVEKGNLVHESETRFLHRTDDLIVPGRSKEDQAPAAPTTTPHAPNDNSMKHAALALLPLALMLPLLLFSIIPTLAGRLAVTTLIGIGAFMAAATTRLREVLAAREWGVVGAVYVLVMAGVAGCVPLHG